MTRLFHVSDLHFGRADEEALRWFQAAVEAERPDAIICTGDLTQRARRQEFAAALAYLERLPVPVTVEPGNHDLPYYNLLERFARPYRRYGKLEKMIERPLDLPRVLIVPLKTTARAQLRRNWSWGVVGRRSLSRALALLEASEGKVVRLVACHHPLLDQPQLHSSGRTIRGREALDALAGAGADAVLSGHVHSPFDVAMEAMGRPIRAIGAGTLSERVRESAPSFNEIHIAEDLAITVIHRWMKGSGAPAPTTIGVAEMSPPTG